MLAIRINQSIKKVKNIPFKTNKAALIIFQCFLIIYQKVFVYLRPIFETEFRTETQQYNELNECS